MFFISSTPFPSSVMMHSHLTPLSLSTYFWLFQDNDLSYLLVHLLTIASQDIIVEYERFVTIYTYLLTMQVIESIIISNLILQTVEAEITAMMPLQRTCGAESQVRNKLSNGPLRVQSNGISQSILQRVGIRQLPGICWYPAKCIGSFL